MFPKLNGSSEESLNSRADTTSRIISMLDVKFKGETKQEQDSEMKLAQMEFNTFLRGYYLTGKEVIEAYRMALSGNLNYKVYPTLSLIQCGEILELYQSFKINSNVRQKALKSIKPKDDEINIDLEKINEEFEMRVYKELLQKGFSEASDIYHSKLKEQGKLKNWSKETKQLFYKRIEKKYIDGIYFKVKSGKETRGFLSKLKKDSEVGVIRPEITLICKRLMVCNYLKKHLETFEIFRESLPK